MSTRHVTVCPTATCTVRPKDLLAALPTIKACRGGLTSRAPQNWPLVSLDTSTTSWRWRPATSGDLREYEDSLFLPTGPLRKIVQSLAPRTPARLTVEDVIGDRDWGDTGVWDMAGGPDRVAWEHVVQRLELRSGSLTMRLRHHKPREARYAYQVWRSDASWSCQVIRPRIACWACHVELPGGPETGAVREWANEWGRVHREGVCLACHAAGAAGATGATDEAEAAENGVSRETPRACVS